MTAVISFANVSFLFFAHFANSYGYVPGADDEASGVDFTQHAETAYAEGVYGNQQARRTLFGDRPRPGDGDEGVLNG